MSNIKELIAKKLALDAEIAAAQAVHKAEAIAQIRALMTEAGLTPADLSPRTVASNGHTRAPAPVKYRDSSTGATWSGRGKRPHWLRDALAAGQSLGAFAAH